MEPFAAMGTPSEPVLPDFTRIEGTESGNEGLSCQRRTEASVVAPAGKCRGACRVRPEVTGRNLTEWSFPVLLSGPLVSHKEEQLVLLHRSAKDTAILILIQQPGRVSPSRHYALANQSPAFKTVFRKYSNAVPWKSLVPLLVTTFTLAPGLRP